MKIISSLSGRVIKVSLFAAVLLTLAGLQEFYVSSEVSLAAGISNASVSLKANSVGNYDGTITFTIGENIGNMMGNKLVITAPQEFSNLTSSQLTCQWLADGTTWGAQMSSKYSLTIMDETISSGEKTCRLDAVKSPSSIYNGKTSGTWNIAFANVAGAAIFSGTAPGVCIGACTGGAVTGSSETSSSSTPAGFSNPSASLSNLAAKATGVTATFKFTTTNAFGVPNFGKVEFTFPSGFMIPATSVVKCTGAGELTVTSKSALKIVLKKTDAAPAFPATVTCTVSELTNPSTEGKTGDFTFTLIDSTGAITLETAKVPGVVIAAAASSSTSSTTSSSTTATHAAPDSSTSTSAGTDKADATASKASSGLTDLEKKLADLEAAIAKKEEEKKAKAEAARLAAEKVEQEARAAEEAAVKAKSEKLKKLQDLLSKKDEEAEDEEEAKKPVNKAKKVAVHAAPESEEVAAGEEEGEEFVPFYEGIIEEGTFDADFTKMTVKQLKAEKLKMNKLKKKVQTAYKEDKEVASEEEKKDINDQLKLINNKFKKALSTIDKQVKKAKKSEKAKKKK